MRRCGLVLALLAFCTIQGCAKTTTTTPKAPRYARAAEIAGNLVCIVLRVTNDTDERIEQICEHAREILRALREYANDRTKESQGKPP